MFEPEVLEVIAATERNRETMADARPPDDRLAAPLA
jgi:hypothetical protein